MKFSLFLFIKDYSYRREKRGIYERLSRPSHRPPSSNYFNLANSLICLSSRKIFSNSSFFLWTDEIFPSLNNPHAYRIFPLFLNSMKIAWSNPINFQFFLPSSARSFLHLIVQRVRNLINVSSLLMECCRFLGCCSVSPARLSRVTLQAAQNQIKDNGRNFLQESEL